MKVTITYRLATRPTNWNKVALQNWARQGKPRLRPDGTPCQPGDIVNSFEEFQAVATAEDGSTLRLKSPKYLQNQTLAELSARSLAAWPNCKIEWKEAA
jgi:hypothetical protein